MSPEPIDANPRKMPRQSRSKATVEAILTGAAQVLVEHGYEGATTARVAERAGVSVGSLYQYFPNKEALVAALVERYADGLVALMRQALADPNNAMLEDGMRAIIGVGIDAHRVSPVLHKVLSEQVPRIGRLAKVMDTHSRIAKEIESYLRCQADQMARQREPATTAIVVETIMEALVDKAVLECPQLLDDGVVKSEILDVVMAYLTAQERRTTPS